MNISDSHKNAAVKIRGIIVFIVHSKLKYTHSNSFLMLKGLKGLGVFENEIANSYVLM